MYGADVAELRALAAQFERTADQLDRNRMAVGSAIRISAWVGPFAATFRVQWDSEHSRRIAGAVALLRENAHRARANADAQERTSAADTGSIGSSTAGPRVLHVPAQGTAPKDVRDWWSSLTPDEQKRLINHDPLEIGNLNGVPLDARAEANRITAESRLSSVSSRLVEMGDEPPEVNPLLAAVPALYALKLAERDRWVSEHKALLDEQGYLKGVANGDRSLIVYDPGQERIVEMIGTPGPNTRNVITYLPGTGTDMSSFHRGGPQQVADYLVNADASGGTVAFVYKDGPWSSWGLPSSDTSNLNMDYAYQKGQQLAAFQDATATEPYFQGARTIGIAHSAGMTILSASEAGANHYDKELSLGGAMLAPGWHADPTTDYYHYQYGVDAINYANPIGDLPVESDAFDKRVYAPNTTTVLGIEIQNELDNHGRIASGPTANQMALLDMYKDIHRD